MSGTGRDPSRAALARVVRNPALRNVQLAFVGSLLGDWAYATALTVWAFHDGGAAAVGTFTAARFVVMAVAGPLGATLADRVPRRTFMVTSDLVRAVLLAGSAVCVASGGPSLLVYAIGLLAAAVGAPFRSAQAGLIPRLVDRPDELTASNAVAGNLENVVTFAGPAIGALLVGSVGVAPVFWLDVATFLWSAFLVAAIRLPPGRGPDGEREEDAAEEPLLRAMGAGFVAVARDGDLRTVSALAAAQGFIWGALTVFLLLMAVDLLGTGASGIGYLNAVLGVATTAGGVIVLSRVARGRLGQDMAVGVLGWALPLLAIAAAPDAPVVLAALVVIGLSDAWVNVGLETIPQRLADDRLLSRVYAAVESALIGAMALGAFAAPRLIDLLGFRGTLAVIGGVVTAYSVWSLRRMRRLDARMSAPSALPLVRSVAMFAPLAPAAQEAVARALRPVEALAGTVVVREGTASDRFFLIVTGAVQVTRSGRVLREETVGDFFGEIGLLRDVPRTATVTATVDSELLALEREDFLRAVSGVSDATAAAEEVVSRRLAV